MIRRALAVTMLLLLPSCGPDYNLFTDQMAFPDDIPCSDNNTCPPNEVCVAGEHYCRYACTNGSCPNPHNSGTGLSCDTDNFCRPNCGGGSGGGTCGGNCPSGQVCDTSNVMHPAGFCRPICSGIVSVSPCGGDFTCAMLPGSSCGGCRPNTSL
jgi:hypothetical protein